MASDLFKGTRAFLNLTDLPSLDEEGTWTKSVLCVLAAFHIHYCLQRENRALTVAALLTMIDTLIVLASTACLGSAKANGPCRTVGSGGFHCVSTRIGHLVFLSFCISHVELKIKS